MKRRLLPLLATCALALASACARHPADSTAPPSSSLSAQIIATNPPARSTGVLYDSDIWAQFDRALDPATVNTLTVYLKLDARRIACAVHYEDITRRIQVTPQVVLDLQKTYTVEFSTSIKTPDGTPLHAAFFQFTTNSLRRVIPDYPTQGALESPFSGLGWSGNGGLSGNIFYEVFVSTDSTAVEQRTTPYVQRSVFVNHLPRTRWPSGATIYWAITVENLTTGERLPSPMRRFQVLEPGAAIDSVTIPVLDFGGNDLNSRTVQYCNRPNIPCGGPRYNGALHWNVSTLPANIRLADARVELTVTPAYANQIPNAQPSLWTAQNDWQACVVNAPGPPFPEQTGNLAMGVATSSLNVRYQSDFLTAFFEAQVRRRPFVYGTLLVSSAPLFFETTASEVAPRAILYYYR